MRILAALTRVDAGQAGVAGFDVRRDRSAVCRRVSVTGQFAMLDEAQAGGENLRMIGRLSRLSRKVVSRSSPEPWYRSDAGTAAAVAAGLPTLVPLVAGRGL